jgi:hypothetical protein
MEGEVEKEQVLEAARAVLVDVPSVLDVPLAPGAEAILEAARAVLLSGLPCTPPRRKRMRLQVSPRAEERGTRCGGEEVAAVAAPCVPIFGPPPPLVLSTSSSATRRRFPNAPWNTRLAVCNLVWV